MARSDLLRSPERFVYRGQHGWIDAQPHQLRMILRDSPGLSNRHWSDCCGNTLQEGTRVNNQIEIDLGLAIVTDGALAMLERANKIATLPAEVFSKLLDALAEEHLRRFGARRVGAAMLKVPTRTLDADELWHSLRLLGNWLSNADEATRSDPDLEGVSDVIARMWMGMRGVLSQVTDRTADQRPRETSN